MNDNKFFYGTYDIEQMKILLLETDKSEELAGFVYPNDDSRLRLPIFKNEKLVGFATPREDKDGVWRMGAIYITPDFRGQGLAAATIRSFMQSRKGRAFIENENIASQRAYKAAGFVLKKIDEKNEGAWWENF